MSLAHELRVVEIESQIELLDRLRLLTRFGSNFTCITGAEGSGKSWIAQRYLEAWAQDKNQSLLMCHPSQSDAQKRKILLNQIVSNPLFNEQDPIVESFARLVQDQACDVVIVIDDAQLLSESLLSELWSLVLEAQAQPSWNVNVVLFLTGNNIEGVLSRLSYGQENKPLTFEIEPFSEQEVEMFMELLVLKHIPGEDIKKKVRRKVAKTAPLPGALMALGERKVERKIIIRSIIGSPVKIAIFALILFLLIAGGYFWLFNQPIPDALNGDDDVSTVSTDASADGEASSDANGASSAETGNSASGDALVVLDKDGNRVVSTDGSGQVNSGQAASENAAEGSQVADNLVEDDTFLPKKIIDHTVIVGNEDEGNRVVVPSDVVDALMDGYDESVEVIDNAVEDARQVQQTAEGSADSSDETPVGATEASDSQTNINTEANTESAVVTPQDVVNGLSATQPETPSSTELSAQSSAQPATIAGSETSSFSFASDELLAVSNNSYTLQLAAMQSVADVEGFITRYGLESQVRVYPTVRNNTDWYIVTYKDFPTIQAARNAKAELSQDVQDLDPWAKSFLQVHREIERAN